MINKIIEIKKPVKTKQKNLQGENELKKLQIFDSSLFTGQSYFKVTQYLFLYF